MHVCKTMPNMLVFTVCVCVSLHCFDDCRQQENKITLRHIAGELEKVREGK